MADAQARPDIVYLIAEHHQAVYRYAYRLTGSVQDAEDLTQQVFLTAHNKIAQLRSLGNAKAWFFAILRNLFYKDRQRKRPMLAADLSLNMELTQISTKTKKDEFDRDQLQDALNRLPDAFRLMVLMFYFEGFSYREIAEHMEIPIGTVMSRLSRAKEYLRSILFEPEDAPRKRTAKTTTEQG